MPQKSKLTLFLVTIILLALACGQFELGVEPTLEDAAPTVLDPTATEVDRSEEERQTGQMQPTHTEEAQFYPTTESNRLDCSQFGVDPLVSIACNVQDSFISRNTQPLFGYMPSEFILGYWQSEWTTVTRENALDYFQQTLIPPNPEGMIFTIDRAQFPPLFGMSPDEMLGPDANIALIIYSEGWGADGQGAVLIFIAEYPTGGYYFPAILVAQRHFDK
jgi:hypothetical protein